MCYKTVEIGWTLTLTLYQATEVKPWYNETNGKISAPPRA